LGNKTGVGIISIYCNKQGAKESTTKVAVAGSFERFIKICKGVSDTVTVTLTLAPWIERKPIVILLVFVELNKQPR
jgi:hypothetical protein